MKTALKSLVGIIALLMFAGAMEKAGDVGAAIFMAVLAVGGLLYYFDTHAERRHAQLINRLDRLWERGQPYRDQ